MTMTPHDRRAAIINKLRPTSDGAGTMLGLLKIEILELGVFDGGDGALDDLARAALAIAYHATRRIVDADLRNELVAAMATKTMSEAAGRHAKSENP
jgi:hypothetical protein